ncbi:MAG: hypothetical protein HOP11_04490 [Saprospiraceae bacterium]|nr:hypothetical protein [Saprospiraceae bacterium]
MKIINFILAFFLIAFNSTSYSQSKRIQISITPTFEHQILHLDDSSFIRNDWNNLQIEVLKFYISNIQFLKSGKLVLEEKNSFHLIDAADKNTWNIVVENHENAIYDEVRYNLGINSSTNAAGALGGDLDPTKGMYWTWQSGYINFKLEGTSSVCKTRNNSFTFHLGGFLEPFYAIQFLSFFIKDQQQINLNLDIAQLLRRIELSKQNHIMSPSTDAVNLSKIVAESFKISEN